MTWLSKLWSRRPRLKVGFAQWDGLNAEHAARRKTVSDHAAKLTQKLNRVNGFQLAVIDTFVEKAQYHLTTRAWFSMTFGLIFAVGCLVIIWSSIAYIVDQPIPTLLDQLEATPAQLTPELIILFVLRSAALAGFAGAAVYFTASLSRAFFHEATAIFNRRHAVRFGRMYLYLLFGETKDQNAVVAEDLRRRGGFVEGVPNDGQTMSQRDLYSFLIHRASVEELERAFGWNLQGSSAFKDIKPEAMSTNIYSKSLDAFTTVVEQLASKIPGGEAERTKL